MKNAPELSIDSLEQYQKWAHAIWNWQSPGEKLKKFTLRDDIIMNSGLGGESGEVLEILKKHARSRKKTSEIDKEHLTEELGDVLYMISIISSRYNIDIVEVMSENITKLEGRRDKRNRVRKAAIAAVKTIKARRNL